jgi:dTDP-4-amino-4,6-dideoxygalactose transaminase
VNSRLDELQAAILRTKLKHLDRWNQLRRQHAYRYNRLLTAVTDSICVPVEGADAEPSEAKLSDQGSDDRAQLPSLQHVYHQYTIRCSTPSRDALAGYLQEVGVGCAVYYPVPLHRQEVNADLGFRAGDLPHAESAAERCLSLPMFPELSAVQQDVVVDHLQRACASLCLSKLSA